MHVCQQFLYKIEGVRRLVSKLSNPAFRSHDKAVEYII